MSELLKHLEHSFTKMYIALKRPALLILLLYPLLAHPGHGQGLSKVQFHAVGPFGDPISHKVDVDGFRDQSGKDWSSKFKDGAADGVPYGTYDASAWLGAQFTNFSGRVELSAPEMIVTAVFGAPELEDGGPIRTTLSGRVEGLGTSPNATWCTLLGIYLNVRYDVILGSNAAFNFGFVPAGSYCVACGSGPQVRFIQQVRVEAGMGPITLHAGRQFPRYKNQPTRRRHIPALEMPGFEVQSNEQVKADTISREFTLQQT